ncbi:MAG: SDR family oxidoreductase [Bacteroidales bacterium]|nr:SDR family oxidoreductase [Bacteroidales bacterium]
MKILVIGSHGKVGKLVVQILAQQGNYVRGMIRDENQSDEIFRLGGKPFVADLEKDFAGAYEDIDTVIFTAGSGSKTGQDKTIAVDQNGAMKSISMAVEYEVSRYIMVSAQGAWDPDKSSKIQHYYKAKAKADNYLISSGLDFTIFRPGKLNDNPATQLIKVSKHFEEPGTTSRGNLAYVIAESLNMPKTFQRIIEILDGDMPISEACEYYCDE